MAIRAHSAVLDDAVSGAAGNPDKGTTEASGLMEFYTGFPPTNLGDATGETLLARVPLADPAFAAPTGGIAEARGVPLVGESLADGEVGWARVLDRDRVVRWDEDDVSTLDSAAITVNTLRVSAGADFDLLNYQLSVAA